MKPTIMQIWQNKGNKQLLITIPKDSGYKVGDYVEITPVLKEVKSELSLRLSKPKNDNTTKKDEALKP